jgi:hypothetical protein
MRLSIEKRLWMGFAFVFWMFWLCFVFVFEIGGWRRFEDGKIAVQLLYKLLPTSSDLQASQTTLKLPTKIATIRSPLSPTTNNSQFHDHLSHLSTPQQASQLNPIPLTFAAIH